MNNENAKIKVISETVSEYKGYKIKHTKAEFADGVPYETVRVENKSKTYWTNTVEQAHERINQEPQNCSPYDYKFANFYGWSDGHAYEIVRVVSEKTIVIRRMKATLNPNWKMDFRPGGFVGHVANQNEQTYTYESDPKAREIRAHRRKDGFFYSEFGRHRLDSAPREFYDYNF